MCEELLRIENFGPIKKAEIPLNRFVVLIGESGTGKSVVMRVAQMVKNIYGQVKDKQLLEKSDIKFDVGFDLESLLKQNLLSSFWQKDSLIEFVKSQKVAIQIKDKKVEIFNENLGSDVEAVISTGFDLRSASFMNSPVFKFALNEFDNKFKLNTMDLELVAESGRFGDEYFLQNETRKTKVKLKEASSGEINVSLLELACEFYAKKFDWRRGLVDSVVSAILSQNKTANFQNLQKLERYVSKNDIKHTLNIFIEEPESNLFPNQQKKIVAYLAFLLGEKNKPNVMIATHSPYILTSLNNLLLAGELYEDKRVDKEALESIVPKKCALKSGEFNAFLLENGELKDILDKELNLIDADAIDTASDRINDEFGEILALRRHDES